MPTVPSTSPSSRSTSARAARPTSASAATETKRGCTPVERTARGDSVPGAACASTRAATSAISAGFR